MPTHTAGVNANETIEHAMADRARLKAALAPDRAMSDEKRAALTARLAEVEQRLAGIKQSLADL